MRFNNFPVLWIVIPDTVLTILLLAGWFLF